MVVVRQPADGDNSRLFRRIDLIVEKIYEHKVDPAFSQDLARRTSTAPDFELADSHILSRMIVLIAFSQQVQSRLVVPIVERGVFDKIFGNYDIDRVARMDPQEILDLHWNAPRNPADCLSPLRFPKKIESMVTCAGKLISLRSTHGSFMSFLQHHRVPARVTDLAHLDDFWRRFHDVLRALKATSFPFFNSITSLCHLLQDLEFSCSKPDSVVMGTAARLGIIQQAQGQKYSVADREHVIRTMQHYAITRNISVPALDLYLLIYGGQTDANRFVQPAYYRSEEGPPNNGFHADADKAPRP